MAHILMQPSGKSVHCATGDTVLMALEKAGYALPSNCRAGACGECKVKVVSGRFDQGMVLDMALSRAERRQGYGLMCMAKPVSDELSIEWGTADARPQVFPPQDDVLFVVTAKHPVANRVVELCLRPVGPPIRYWPGQYITLGKPAAGIPARAYSIANAPRPDGELVLQVARADGGATSEWIHDQLQSGDTVRIGGAYGSFIGDPSVDTPILCLAGGSGLAPILALTEAALRRGFARPVTLLFSARRADDVFARGLMAWWQARHANFDYRITLSRESRAGFASGRIAAVLPGMLGLSPDLSRHTVFAAGSPAFVDSCVASVKALGARDELIHTEGFFARQQPPIAAAGQLLLPP